MQLVGEPEPIDQEHHDTSSKPAGSKQDLEESVDVAATVHDTVDDTLIVPTDLGYILLTKIGKKNSDSINIVS